jgi:hypothetical protein
MGSIANRTLGQGFSSNACEPVVLENIFELSKTVSRFYRQFMWQ